MYGALSVRGVVDVERVNSNQCCAPFHECSGSRLDKERMIGEVLGCVPVSRPPRVEQDRVSTKIVGGKVRRPQDLSARTDHDTWECCYRFELESGEVFAPGVAVERRIEIGARVRDHFDSTYVERRARGVPGLGIAVAAVSADDRRRQSRVRPEPVENVVAEVD